MQSHNPDDSIIDSISSRAGDWSQSHAYKARETTETNLVSQVSMRLNETTETIETKSTDPVVHVRLNSGEQAEQFRPLIDRWRSENQAALFACVGTTFDRKTGDIVLELHAVVVPKTVAKKACNVLLKGVAK